MNRTDRLYALVEELRARAPRPVAGRHLAGRFEVSLRTIERDIVALMHAGVPIWTERGRRGGYALDPRTTLPPLNFTPEEAAALSTALAACGDMPFGEAGRTARRKLAAAMSAVGLEDAQTLTERIRLRPVSSDARPDVVRAVEQAVRGRLVVEVAYADRKAKVTARAVEAHGLLGGRDGWYLVGWCRLRDGGRVFRVDRILDARVTAERAPERDLDAVLDVPFAVERPSLVE